MRRALAIIVLALGGLFGGCTCGSKSSAPAPVASATASASASSIRDPAAPLAPMTDAASAATYSNPIAAARIANGDVVVAGLFAAGSAISLTGFSPSGSPQWTAEVLRGVTWTADAELRVLPAGDGAAVVWRGSIGDKVGRFMARVGPRGEPRDDVLDVGSALCTTSDGFAWIDRNGTEPVHVRARAWNDATTRDLLELPPEPMPTLACGDRQVHVVVDGEDDLQVTTVPSADGGVPSPIVMSRDKDFGDDAEDDHKIFTVGDDLGVVRVGESGAIAVRELRHGVLGEWRKLKSRLGTDDDVIVAVDGDASTLLIVYAHDQSDRCTVAVMAKSLHAVRLDRNGTSEVRSLLAGAECGKETGPFWIGSVARGIVAWVERGKRSDPNAAPIRALASRIVGADADSPTRIEQPADAIVEGGCDPAACFAAALVRDPGADGMAPEAVRLLRF